MSAMAFMDLLDKLSRVLARGFDMIPRNSFFLCFFQLLLPINGFSSLFKFLRRLSHLCLKVR